MDRRQQKTRKAIFDAFERLMITKNYRHITVQDIIDEANIGRSTFYAHFETKDSLLQEMCAELFEHVFSCREVAGAGHDFSFTDGDTHIAIAHMLYHLKDHGANISRLLMGESSTIFAQYFKEYLDEFVMRYILVGLDYTNCPIPQDFLQNHLSSSFVSMVQWWIEDDMKETPEEMAEYYLAVIKPIL